MKKIESMLSKFTRSLAHDIKGQALVMVAGALALLIGFGALATDVGYLYVQRRNAQNLADSAALAGTWVISGGNSAVNTLAKDYAEQHGFQREDIEAMIVNDRYVEATVSKEHNMFLMRVLGVDTADVGAKAVATRTSIWSPGLKDVLPLGLIGWNELFYRVVKDDIQNKHDAYYDLFNDKKHELYGEFENRYGILKDEIRDFLIDKYPADVIYIIQNNKDFILPDATDPGTKYPSLASELKLLKDIDVYKEVLQKMITDNPDKIFDILFGTKNLIGNFGYLTLDKPGANELEEIIINGYKKNIGNIIPKTGYVSGIADKGGPLDNYIQKNHGQAYIFAILPDEIGTGGSWDALGPDPSTGKFREYLVLHVTDMKLEFKTGKDPRLTGKVNRIFDKVSDLNTNDGYWEEVLQSWLVE